MSEQKICKIEICDKPARYGKLLLCTGHYQRQRKGADLSSPVEKRETHGYSYSRTYRSWEAMCTRCTSTTAREYPQYGGKGIKVAERWVGSFQNFLEDMGDRPENTSLDRIDNNGDYTTENCRWADKSIQQRNQNPSTRNKTGTRGVTWVKRLNKFTASIQIRGDKYFLGNFRYLEEAIEARKKAEIKYNYRSA